MNLPTISQCARNNNAPALCPGVKGPPAFTILEILVVISLAAVIAALAIPAISNMNRSGGLTNTVYGIQGVLDQARSFAMAHNTTVFVGIGEFDSSTSISARPQVPGIGRLVLAVVAAKDGSRGYDITNPALPSPAWSNYNNGSNLMAVGKLFRFDNTHLLPSSSLPTEGGMNRLSVSSPEYQLGEAASDACVTPFDWPPGSAIGSGQYSFKRVISFDSQGVARIQYAGNTDSIVRLIEIGLSSSRGNTVSPVVEKNVAAIQIDGMTGSTRVYRP